MSDGYPHLCIVCGRNWLFECADWRIKAEEERDAALRDLALLSEQVDAARAATEQMKQERDEARNLREADFLLQVEAIRVARMLRAPAKRESPVLVRELEKRFDWLGDEVGR